MLFVRKNTSPSSRRLAHVLSLVVASALVSGFMMSVAAAPAQAEDAQSFSGAPADGEHSDSTRTRFTFGGDPGQSITDSYYIENTGSLPQDLTVFATDAYNADDGTFSLLDTNTPATGVGAWVAIDGAPRQVITLEPNSSKVVPITITIPADARPGDHVGGIVVSATSKDGQVKLERRVATRLYLRVTGELQPALTVGGLAATYQPDLNPFNGKVVLTYTVKNTGNVAVGANIVSQITGLFGVPLSGLVTSSMPELLPDGTHVMTTSVPGVWQWVWATASISLAGTIDKNAPSPGAMPTATREAVLWAVPWALLVLLMAALFVFLYIRLSRASNDRRSQQWMEYTEAEALSKAREDSLQS